MVYILSIETTTTNCSVSLSKNGETLHLKEDDNNGFSHAEKLHVYIDEVLTSARLTIKDLDAIAVSKGPGSYTGLRIGVSAAKGLCFALNIPLIAIPTLEALAHQVKKDEGFIAPVLDARRMEVYSAVYSYDYQEINEVEAKILDELSYADLLENNNMYFVGSGVQKMKDIILHKNANFIENKLPSANEMSALAYAKYQKSNTEDVAYFEPYYLKDFVAIKPKSKN